jgi:hypothetical protein
MRKSHPCTHAAVISRTTHLAFQVTKQRTGKREVRHDVCIVHYAPRLDHPVEVGHKARVSDTGAAKVKDSHWVL